MDKIKMLQERVTLLKSLIEKEDDEAKAKSYSEQYDETLREIMKEEAKAEVAEETKKLQEKVASMESEQAKIFEGENLKIGAGKTELYKGFNLNREVEYAGMRAGQYADVINKRFAANPDRAMGLAKMFIDKFVDAQEMSPLKVKALQEGTDSEGGYVTPTEQRFELVAYVREASKALQYGRHFSMTSDVMTVPAENAKVSVGVTAEESDATETTPSFSEITLTAKRYDGYGTTSNELLEDAAINGGIVGMLLDQFIEATGLALDSVAFTAPGNPASGILVSAGASVVFDSGSTAFSEILEADLREALRKVKPEYRAGGVWLWNDELTWDYIYGMKDSDGNYLFTDSRAGGAAPEKLWGYPILPSSKMNAVSDSGAGKYFGVFGNLRGLFIGDRITNFQIMLDPYTNMISHQTRYYSFTRWAVAVGLPNYFCSIKTAAS